MPVLNLIGDCLGTKLIALFSNSIEPDKNIYNCHVLLLLSSKGIFTHLFHSTGQHIDLNEFWHPSVLLGDFPEMRSELL